MLETIISCCILALFVFIGGSIVYYSSKNGITPAPTLDKAKQGLLGLLARKKINGNIYELGSGWGTLAFALAKQYAQCNVIGYENSIVPYMFSQVRHLFTDCENLKLVCKDFYTTPLNDADLVVCYLYTGAMVKLRNKFENELKKGAIVVSHTFAIPHWIPAEEIVVDDMYRNKIYLYIVGRH
ncbi:MAG: methyltransferase [Desulfobacteraceae bacterium]|jgi:cyclopropane fatty-acyl-phospholipid synthase-like methyltransferase